MLYVQKKNVSLKIYEDSFDSLSQSIPIVHRSLMEVPVV